MTLTSFAVAYVAATVVFLVIDAIWLGSVVTKFYFSRLSHVIRKKPNLGVAALFYLVYILGIVVFAVEPGVREGSLMLTAAYGALLGFVAYGTYDFTNLATIRDWPWIITLVDIIWGTALTMVSAIAGHLAVQWVI